MTTTTTPAGELVSPRPRSCSPMAREMTTDQVRDFLSRGTRTAKVATVMGDGRPHVMPVWFVLDGEQLVFTTGADSVKGRNLRRDPRIALLVDDETPPHAFVHVRGRIALHEDLGELLRFATAIGGRYMGQDRAEESGRRNAVPGELLVRVTPERVIAEDDVAGYDLPARSGPLSSVSRPAPPEPLESCGTNGCAWPNS